MKVTFPNNGDYSAYNDFQFAYIETYDEENNKAVYLQNCKEVFSGYLGKIYSRPVGRNAKRFRFLLLYTGDGKKLNLEATQNFLNQAEKRFGFSRSKVWDITEDAPQGTQAFLIESSTAWLRNSPMAHLLLILARNGSGHNPKEKWHTTLTRFRDKEAFKPADQAQFMILNEVIPHILEKKGHLENFFYGKPENDEQKWQIGYGICQYAQKLKEAAMPVVSAAAASVVQEFMVEA